MAVMVATPGTTTETPTTPTGTGPAGTEPPAGAETVEPGSFDKTQADFDALQLALSKERKAHRDAAARATALEQEHATDDEKVWMDKVEAATHAADAKLKKIAARSALAAAGLQGKPDRLVAVLNLDAIDVDDDGNVAGLDKEIAQLKADFPSLFVEPKTPSAVPGALNIGSRPGPKPKAKGFAEQVAATLQFQ
jgi:hypothetical protein